MEEMERWRRRRPTDGRLSSWALDLRPSQLGLVQAAGR